MRLSLRELAPARALKQLSGKKGVRELAILRFGRRVRDGCGKEVADRVVVLCDDVKELVGAMKSLRT